LSSVSDRDTEVLREELERVQHETMTLSNHVQATLSGAPFFCGCRY
jgi:hypothetical protein